MLMFLYDKELDRNVANMMSECWVIGRGHRLVFSQNCWYAVKPCVYFFLVDWATDCAIRWLAVCWRLRRDDCCTGIELLVGGV